MNNNLHEPLLANDRDDSSFPPLTESHSISGQHLDSFPQLTEAHSIASEHLGEISQWVRPSQGETYSLQPSEDRSEVILTLFLRVDNPHRSSIPLNLVMGDSHLPVVIETLGSKLRRRTPAWASSTNYSALHLGLPQSTFAQKYDDAMWQAKMLWSSLPFMTAGAVLNCQKWIAGHRDSPQADYEFNYEKVHPAYFLLSLPAIPVSLVAFLVDLPVLAVRRWAVPRLAGVLLTKC